MKREPILSRDLIGSWEALLRYLRARQGFKVREEFRVLFLDARNHLIREEVMSRGDATSSPIHVRYVVRRALMLDASAVILAHNHPSGDLTPSRADVHATRAIVCALKAVEVTVHDHVIVSATGHASLKVLGLL